MVFKTTASIQFTKTNSTERRKYYLPGVSISRPANSFEFLIRCFIQHHNNWFRNNFVYENDMDFLERTNWMLAFVHTTNFGF